MSIFGDLERFLSEDLYPYRWPLAIGLAFAIIVFGVVAYRQGWHRWVWSHRLPATAIGVPLIALVAVGGYPLVSPLFTRNTVCEASPIAGADAGSEKCEVESAVAATNEPALPTAAAATRTASSQTPDDTPIPTAAPEPVFEARTVLEGQFRDADDFHTGEGTALVIETAPRTYTLRFEEFSVRNGPDLYVYLSPNADDYTGDSLELGKLKGTDGAFNYEVPAGTDISRYKSVVVWCKPFSVLFTVASLSEAP